MNWLTKIFSGDHPAASLPEALRGRLERWRVLEAPALDANHGELRYVIVNTEATGLDPANDRLLAVAAIGIDRGVLAHRDAFEMSLDTPAQTLVALLEFIGKSPVVVFNADLNRQALMAAFETHLGFEPDLEWLDLYWLLPCLFNDKHDRPVRLKDWMKTMAVETFQRHRALGDAFAIAKLFLAAQSRATIRGLRTPRSLMELATTRKRQQRAIRS
ncbi:3'-5' exonuclease [Nitrogeniibacter mangrovi]|uniref:3'-5' exonuclease n=1 Tax=Nitrogeniibacter mangrovi TaxID=2016596 RepID=A0A6C1B389_9RHOO|nr:3'-5' exonuclease [Nitrogeniibacter mangrovi]QID18122.1 3'-5' exonuclease [Nitrogeniibacter mangrovi]